MSKLLSLVPKFKLNHKEPRAYLIYFVLVNFCYFLIRLKDWWKYLSVPTMNPGFADLRAYTAQVSCAEQGINYMLTICDHFGRNVTFLQVWVPLFKLLHLNDSKAALIGNMLQLSFFAAIYLLAYKLNINITKMRNLIPLTLILFSPPIALLVERGQTEMFLFVATTICVFCVRNGRNTITFIILGILSVFKIYPFILIFIILGYRPILKKRSDLVFGVNLLALVAVIIIFNKKVIYEMTQNSISGGFGRTFGITNIPYLILKVLNHFRTFQNEISLERVQIQIIGLLLFCLVVISILISKLVSNESSNFSPLPNNLFSVIQIIFLSLIFISYFLVSSFDYRMCYFVPLFLGYLKISENVKLFSRSYFLVIFILALLWAQYYRITSALAQPFILIYFSFVTLKIWYSLKNMYFAIR